jgi:hypothetical protein
MLTQLIFKVIKIMYSVLFLAASVAFTALSRLEINRHCKPYIYPEN